MPIVTPNGPGPSVTNARGASVASSASSAAEGVGNGELPPQIVSMLGEITTSITDTFPRYPPHTLQRLAELVLRPKQHYRHLIPYLHALDRVVHVTSGANAYPLPVPVPDVAGMNFLSSSSGSDENPAEKISWANSTSSVPTDETQLGGAKLTLIPWLARPAEEATAAAGSAGPGGPSGEFKTESTETIDGPNGMGSIETVSINLSGGLSPSPLMTQVGANTLNRSMSQGELMRQEQVDAIAAKASGEASSTSAAEAEPTNANIDNSDTTVPTVTVAVGSEEDEAPHARGPGEIGAADTGPQQNQSGRAVNIGNIDLEAAVGGRQPVAPTDTRDKKEEDTEMGEGNDDDEDDDDTESRALSPKREAEDELVEGLAAKKAKTDSNTNSDVRGETNTVGVNAEESTRAFVSDTSTAAMSDAKDAPAVTSLNTATGEPGNDVAAAVKSGEREDEAKSMDIDDTLSCTVGRSTSTSMTPQADQLRIDEDAKRRNENQETEGGNVERADQGEDMDIDNPRDEAKEEARLEGAGQTPGIITKEKFKETKSAKGGKKEDAGPAVI